MQLASSKPRSAIPEFITSRLVGSHLGGGLREGGRGRENEEVVGRFWYWVFW